MRLWCCTPCLSDKRYWGKRMRNRRKTATPAVQSFIEDKANDIEDFVENQPSDDDGADGLDDNWLDDLTPYEEVKTEAAVQEPEVVDSGTEAQQARLAELYENLEHIDSDVASELHDKLLSPELDAVRKDLAELKQYQKQEREAKQSKILADINAKIVKKYPKAEQIFRSKEFVNHVNASGNPYATDTEFNILMRAYYAGDADYVISKIDGFVATRGKPKPPIGAEPQQGGGRSGVADAPKQVKPMTDAEYLAKRKAIKAAPKGSLPPDALRKLVKEYLESNGKG